MICFDMRQIEQNNLKKEAAKRPKKIQRYSMMMLICIRPCPLRSGMPSSLDI